MSWEPERPKLRRQILTALSLNKDTHLAHCLASIVSLLASGHMTSCHLLVTSFKAFAMGQLLDLLQEPANAFSGKLMGIATDPFGGPPHAQGTRTARPPLVPLLKCSSRADQGVRSCPYS